MGTITVDVVYNILRTSRDNTNYLTETFDARTTISARVLEVCNSSELAVETGRIKCERAISIAGCSCIATGKLANTKVVFAIKEEELTREMERKPFDVEIVFLEE